MMRAIGSTVDGNDDLHCDYFLHVVGGFIHPIYMVCRIERPVEAKRLNGPKNTI